MKWGEFIRRYRVGFEQHDGDFYAVIDNENHWVDSSTTFDLAVHWALESAGVYDPEDSLEANIVKLGISRYSVIHARFLKPLFDQGLLK